MASRATRTRRDKPVVTLRVPQSVEFHRRLSGHLKVAGSVFCNGRARSSRSTCPDSIGSGACTPSLSEPWSGQSVAELTLPGAVAAFDYRGGSHETTYDFGAMARPHEASGHAPSPGVDPVVRVPGITGTVLCGVDLGVCRAYGSAVARGRPRKHSRSPREPWMIFGNYPGTAAHVAVMG